MLGLELCEPWLKMPERPLANQVVVLEAPVNVYKAPVALFHELPLILSEQVSRKVIVLILRPVLLGLLALLQMVLKLFKLEYMVSGCTAVLSE